MHRSKLSGFIIDCRTDDLAAAAQFWSAALGMAVKPPPSDYDGKYLRMIDPSGEIDVEVQRVDHESRVHLDIESDDVEAEVRRLEALGAKRVGYVRTWCVMEAPTGQRFCVVRRHAANFEKRANTWE